MDTLRPKHSQDGREADMDFIFDGFMCSKPSPSAVLTIAVITVCVAILNLLSPRFQHSGLSLPARVFWVAFWLSFLAASFYGACWFTAIAYWGLRAFNPLQAGPNLGVARTLLDAVIFALMLVGALLFLAFLVAAVSIVTYFKLLSAFSKERPYATSKSILG